MSSSNFKNKQFQSLIRKRTSSAYGSKPVDTLYKKTDKSNTEATRNFDPEEPVSPSKPHTRPRQKSIGHLLQDTTRSRASKAGDPTRKRLDSLVARTTDVIKLDKTDNESSHTRNSNASNQPIYSDGNHEVTRPSSHFQSNHRYHSNASSHDATKDDHFTMRRDKSFCGPRCNKEKDNSTDDKYSEKLEKSSRIRERLDSLTSHSDRLVERKSSYAFQKGKTNETSSRKTIVSPQSRISKDLPVSSPDSLSPTSDQARSRSNSGSASPILIAESEHSISYSVSPSASQSGSPSVSLSPAPSISSEPGFTEVEDCDGNKLDVKECSMCKFPKVRHVLKSFQYHDQKIRKRNHRKIYEIAVSQNGKYIYIGWQHPSLDLVPLNKFVVNIESQLKDFSFANESFIMQLISGQRFIIASHYGRDDDIRQYFTNHPNSKVKVESTLTESAQKRLMDRAYNRSKYPSADPFVKAGFQRPQRSSPRLSQPKDDGIEFLGDYTSGGEGLDFFDDSDYNQFEKTPDFKPELRYKFHDGTELTVDESDFRTLHRNNWVNDVIIDFGLKYIIQEGVKKGLVQASEIHSFNSFFYTKLTSGTTPDYYNNIKRWLSKLDLMKFQHLIIPVNQSSHWYCCIIRNLPGLLQSAQERKWRESEPIDVDDFEIETKSNNQYAEIFVLDSLGSKRYNVSVPLKSFIIDYCKEKFDVEINRDQIRFQSARIPRQNNFNDCGVHVLYNIRKWLSNIIECESFFKKHSQSQAKAIFPADERRKERKYWSNILLELHRAQNQPQKDETESVYEDDDDDEIEIVEERVFSKPTSQSKKKIKACKTFTDGDGTVDIYEFNYNPTKSESQEESDTDQRRNDTSKDNKARESKNNADANADQDETRQAGLDKTSDDHEVESVDSHIQEEIKAKSNERSSVSPISKVDETRDNSPSHSDGAKESNSMMHTFTESPPTEFPKGMVLLKNLILREQFKDDELNPSICHLLNQHFQDETTVIKGVRLIMIKKHIEKAVENPVNLEKLEKLLESYANSSTENKQNQETVDGASVNSSTFRKVFPVTSSSNSGDVTNRIENLQLSNSHFDSNDSHSARGAFKGKTQFVSLSEFRDQERRRNDSLGNYEQEASRNGNHSKRDSVNPSPRAISTAEKDANAFRRVGFRSSRGGGNPTTNGFGTKGFSNIPSAEFVERKNAASEIVKADGFDTAARFSRGSVASDDSDVILDYPHSPFKRRKLD
ncbi:hypothetical protein CANMA_003082 [Candida margitis]|uniref:uncharacterized protein n=1 Tax=Candida margitis TaxID=1775924 RepID=UPI0022273CF2|nr:uncharacterized protein CANMA_003082 [Candida margitis]KAI5967262.1 hypothetical protein CANMA_003082 [Candida margitis]